VPDVKLAPSLLAADFADLAGEIASARDCGAKLLHLDVMDNHFVPNLSFGPKIMAAVRKLTDLKVIVHLMVADPKSLVEAFVDAGADGILAHAELPGCREALELARRKGASPGAAVNPETRPAAMESFLDVAEHVLVMTVHPGFGGQTILPEVFDKIGDVRRLVGERLDMAVDGGVTVENAARIVALGANVIVAGTAFFGAADRKLAARRLVGG